MNYIGSKATLLPFIQGTIQNFVQDKIEDFTDLFAGTGCVGFHFKKSGVRVIANDLQYYSYSLCKHLIGNNIKPNFSNISSEIPRKSTLFTDTHNDLVSYLEQLEGLKGFIFRNYAPSGSENERMYFSDENAMQCDAIRMKIEQWRISGSIDEGEYYWLLASLIESIDRYANTASVYGAYLKSLKKSAKQKMRLSLLPVVGNSHKNIIFNEDANSLIKNIEGQILYLDPPYNHRQYATNYHLLETIARYDNPIIYGKTGLRRYEDQKSGYCQKALAKDCLEDLIMNAHYDYIFLSYNNEGLIPIEFIQSTMKRRGKYQMFEIDYARYKADNSREYKDTRTTEYLHCVKVR